MKTFIITFHNITILLYPGKFDIGIQFDAKFVKSVSECTYGSLKLLKLELIKNGFSVDITNELLTMQFDNDCN